MPCVDDAEQFPGVVIRFRRLDDPVAVVTDHDAVQRAEAYPILRIGAPLFGHAIDLGGGRWRIHGLVEDTPQAARDALAHRLRERLVTATDADLVAELAAVGEVLDWQKVDEVTVGGRRHRVIRADTFARFGPAGPEPPRPTDLDPRQADTCDSFLGGADLIADPAAPTGVGAAVLKVELLPARYPKAEVSPAAYADSVAAVRSHPNGVLLPTRYAVAEQVAGVWQPSSRAVATPQQARELILFDFRWLTPRIANPGEAAAAEYRRAADDLEASRADEVSVRGRRLRVIRVETLLRFAADGPERPRPSDPDPEPPPEAHFARLRAEGRLPEPD
ncbi:DUF5954 family protein [Micromonospora maris]|uniref:PE-PGRS family protein n=1 Tax=Micromonospora maris TaxID=1003110 RepID=A0A9X0I072_9ACTN|nr:DUF5954 family protein [Micromonospora maris]KUJ44406.1 hypothetical protein ADL17_14495 [Micromonospora maris]